MVGVGLESAFMVMQGFFFFGCAFTFPDAHM